MMRMIPVFMILLLTAPAFSQVKATQTIATDAQSKVFDPHRDAAKDIAAAVAEAARSGKRVLVDVGGNWCIWCHEMERYLEEHADLRALRDRNYVTVKVNWSPENKNEAVLSTYPKIPGYPHLFVLDGNGALIHSQDTSKLEDGKKSYDLKAFTAFLTQWAPAGK
jgi:thiol:disulfide interchange protein